jgi:hypothetical protein
VVCSPLQKQVVGSSRVAFHCRLEEGGPRWAVFFLCPKLIGLAGVECLGDECIGDMDQSCQETVLGNFLLPRTKCRDPRSWAWTETREDLIDSWIV